MENFQFITSSPLAPSAAREQKKSEETARNERHFWGMPIGSLHCFIRFARTFVVQEDLACRVFPISPTFTFIISSFSFQNRPRVVKKEVCQVEMQRFWGKNVLPEGHSFVTGRHISLRFGCLCACVCVCR